MATRGGRASGVTRRIGTEKGDEDSSESDGETEPAKSFHRRLSTNKEIKYAAATESTRSAAPIDVTTRQELRSSSQGGGDKAASCYQNPLSPRSQPPPRRTKAATKEGFLMKQTWSFNRWRRRYFQLKGHKLYYAKDPKEVDHEPMAEARKRPHDAAAMLGEHTCCTSGVLIPSQLNALLDTALQWEFDIFQLEQLSGHRPLFYLGMKLFLHFGVPQTLHVDVNTIHNWLSVIETNYNAANWYHNSTHAADALQTSAVFLEQDRLKRAFNPLDVTCCLIAVAAHDVDHPGRTNAFLSNSSHPLAIMYNDISVLESHHIASAFRLTLSDDRINIFKALQRHVYQRVRFSIIDMVLATDMSRHFEHLGNFVNSFFREVRKEQRKNRKPLLELVEEPEGAVMTAEQLAIVKRIIIKCADVSNPMRPLSLCVEWALRISEEYFEQTDDEKSRNLPLALPMFDRASCSIPKSQIGFVDYIIKDMFEAWERFISMPVLIENLERNYSFWEEKEQQGIRLIKDFASPVLMDPSCSEGSMGTMSATKTPSDMKLAPLFFDEMAQCVRGEDCKEHYSDLS